MMAAMNRNEMPYDIPLLLKRQIGKRIRGMAFNTYPEPFAQSLVSELANRYGCSVNQLMVAPGSSAFIRLLLTYFRLRKSGQIVIARPSFDYYEIYCDSFGIPYLSWELDENLEFTAATLPKLSPQSLVILASPNNPTGRPIQRELLQRLLEYHPEVTWVIDEAYAEFCGSSHISLVDRYPNLVILRTLSKAFSAAAVRCGALIASPVIVQELTRVQTPFQLSSITAEIVKLMLSFDRRTNWSSLQIARVLNERDRWLDLCRSAVGDAFTIHPTNTHFVLIRAQDASTHQNLLEACKVRNIAISDLSSRPRLEHSVRVNVAAPAANDAFADALSEIAHAGAKPLRGVAGSV